MNAMTPIYLSSVGMIGLMVFAAVANRRSGWRKQRGTDLRDVFEMSALWKGLRAGWRAGLRSDDESEAPLARPEEAHLTIESVANFSGQLVNLQAALNPLGRIVPETVARVAVPIKSKILV